MTNYDWLKSLEDEGRLKPLLKSGIISPTINNYFSVFKIYEYEIIRHSSRMDAIQKVCEAQKTNQELVYRAIRLMKAELQ